MKKVVIVLSVICVLLLGTTLSISFIYKHKVKEQILEEIDKNIHANVIIGDIGVGFIHHFPKFSLSLHHLCITGKGAFEKDTLIQAKRLDFQLDIKKLLKYNKLKFTSIHLIEPHIHIKVLKDGSANYNIQLSDTNSESTNQPPANFSSINLDIEKITLKHGFITYKNLKNRLYINAEEVNHYGRGNFKEALFDWKTKTTIQKITLVHNHIRYLNRKETDLNLTLKADTRNKRFTFKENTIRVSQFQFGIQGFFELQNNGYNMNLQIAAKETLFKNILSLVPGIYKKDLTGIKTDGDLVFNGYIRGSYNKENQQLPAFHIDCKVKDAMFKFDSLPVPAKNIQFHLIADNRDGDPKHTIWDLKTLRMTLDKNSINGSIRWEGYKNCKITADMHVDMDLNDLRKFYPVKTFDYKGNLKVHLKAKGIYNKALKRFPAINASIILQKGFIKSKAYSEAMKNILLKATISNTTGTFADTRVRIDSLTYTFDNEAFQAKGHISDFEKFDYDLKIKGDIDLNKITRIYPLPELNLSGIIHADVESRGNLADIKNKEYSHLFAQGEIALKDITISDIHARRNIQIRNALFFFHPEKIVMQRFTGNIGKGHISMSGSFSDYMTWLIASDELIKAELSLKCDTLDISEWQDHKSDSLATKNKDFQGRRAPLVPEHIDFILDTDIKYCQYNDMRITNMNGQIGIKDGILTLKETGFNTLNATFTVSGDYNTTHHEQPFFDLDIAIEKLDINKAYKQVSLIRTLAPAAQNMSGIFSIHYQLKADLSDDMKPILNTLEGGGEIRIHQARIKGMKIFEQISKKSKKQELNNPSLRDLVLETEIRDNKVLVKPCSLKLSGLDATIEGVSNFNKRTMDFVIRIELIPPIKKIKIPFHVTGTYNDPKIAPGKGEKIKFNKI